MKQFKIRFWNILVNEAIELLVINHVIYAEASVLTRLRLHSQLHGYRFKVLLL